MKSIAAKLGKDADIESAVMAEPRNLSIGLVAAGLMVAFAGVLVIMAALALSRWPNEPAASAANREPEDQNLIDSDPFRENLTRLIGAEVVAKDGRPGGGGMLEGVIFDNNGATSAVIISYGGFLAMGSKEVMVDVNDVTIDSGYNTIRVNFSRDELEAMPENQRRYLPMQAAEVPPEIADQLKEASVAFNAPDRLFLNEAARIQFALAPVMSPLGPEEVLDPNLSGTIRMRDGIDYALRMRADLSGPDFRIDPQGPQIRTVLDDRTTEWNWTITPTRPGENRILTLSLLALLKQGEEDLPPLTVQTFREQILVDVSAWDRIRLYLEKVNVIHGVVAALVGTALAIAGGLGWRRAGHRRGEKANPLLREHDDRAP
ncbi:PRC-barrel domain-containing protein [Kineobactrum salinum]|uniref:Uncharacterized protein n=1 Tax=Kineobactrum salinum TaxID=2708301 RepID=A0A6C0TZC7_9GAMM|nr:PRC-barrel domain-containing protein [Kineobactrum salinum]QIB65141.1 hypothetical protein G3T16_06720 [Kineobactrum salinum]